MYVNNVTMENQTATDLRNLLAWVKGPGPVNPNITLRKEQNTQQGVGVELSFTLDDTDPGSMSGTITQVAYHFVANLHGHVAIHVTYESKTLERSPAEYIDF